MRVTYDEAFYSSGTVVVTGNSGVIATPGKSPINLVVPLWFICVGADQATDETNDVKIDWYADSAGAYTFGTTTFAQMTAGDMVPPLEYWPGDVSAWDIDYTGASEPPNPPWIVVPPYCKITHTMVGTTKSMSYTVTMSSLQIG